MKNAKRTIVSIVSIFVFLFVALFSPVHTEKYLFSQDATPEGYLISNNCSIQWEQRGDELHAISVAINNQESVIECLEKACHLPHLKNLIIMPVPGIQKEQVEYLNQFKDLESLFIQGIDNNFLESGQTLRNGQTLKNKQALSIKDTISAISHMTTLKTLVLKEITANSSNDFSGLESLVNLENIAIGSISEIPLGSFMWLPQNVRQYNVYGKLFHDDLQHTLNRSNITFFQGIFEKNDFDSLTPESLRHLAELNSYGYISKKMILNLRNKNNLETMRFLYCNFEKGALSEIKNIKALKKIELFQCTFSDDECPIEILSHNKQIQEIILGLNFSDEPKDVSPLNLCDNLKSLSIVGCSYVTGLNSLMNMRHLKISSAGMKSLHTSSLDNFENLQDLEIENLTIYGQFPHLPKLKKLTLSSVKIEHLLFFQKLKSQLQSFSLTNTKISEESTLQIIRNNQDSLKHLVIAPIETQNIINSIFKCRKLQTISARIMTEVKNATFKDLPELESISLSMDALSHQIVSDFASLPKLRILDLSRCNINEGDIAVLKESSSLQEFRFNSNQTGYSTIRSLPFKSVYSGPYLVDPFQRYFMMSLSAIQ